MLVKTGIQVVDGVRHRGDDKDWIPAYAGMTIGNHKLQSIYS